MNVILFGGTGMVGGGVLVECLEDPRVSSVLAVGRRPTGRSHPKLREVLRADLFDLTDLRPEMTAFDACFFCIGISAVGMTETAYHRVTFDLAVSVADLVKSANPSIRLCFVSGQGADETEESRSMWARVKGKTENHLLRALDTYVFRPGFILPLKGVRSRTALYRLLYGFSRPFHGWIRRAAPKHVTTSENIGRAMITVAENGCDVRILENPDIDRMAGSRPATSPE